MSDYATYRDRAISDLTNAHDDGWAEASEAQAQALVWAVLALAEAVRETGGVSLRPEAGR